MERIPKIKITRSYQSRSNKQLFTQFMKKKVRIIESENTARRNGSHKVKELPEDLPNYTAAHSKIITVCKTPDTPVSPGVQSYGKADTVVYSPPESIITKGDMRSPKRATLERSLSLKRLNPNLDPNLDRHVRFIAEEALSKKKPTSSASTRKRRLRKTNSQSNVLQVKNPEQERQLKRAINLINRERIKAKYSVINKIKVKREQVKKPHASLTQFLSHVR